MHEQSFEDLADYVEGRLDRAEASRLEAHLAGCARCQADVAWLRRTLGLMASDRLADAPERAVRRAQGLCCVRKRGRGVDAATLAGLWRGLLAPRLRPALLTALVVVLVIACTWAWGGVSVAQAATLAEVQGPVEVLMADGGAWQPANSGQTLSAGCTIRAGEGGLVAIVYADGSRSYLADNAEVSILELSGQRNRGRMTIRLDQVAGHTQHQLASPASLLRVQVGEAEVEASAATYDVWVSDGEMEVVTSRGQVTLRSAGSKERVGEGERGHASQGAPPVTGKSVPTAVGHGRSKPSATPGKKPTPKDTRTPPGKAERTLVPPKATPAARDRTPPGKAETKPGKPQKTKTPRPHWPWTGRNDDLWPGRRQDSP